MNRFDPRYIMLAAMGAVYDMLPKSELRYVHDTAYTRSEAAAKVARAPAAREAAVKRRALRDVRRAYCYSRCVNNNQCLRG